MELIDARWAFWIYDAVEVLVPLVMAPILALRHRPQVDPELFPATEASDGNGGVVAQAVWWGPSDPIVSSLPPLVASIHAARKQLSLATAYFVPDDAVLLALRVAARRGVQVELVVPMRSDKRIVDAASRSRYLELVDAGIDVYRHRDGILHSKCMAVDDKLAVVGSSNLDNRSFYLDFEANVMFYDATLAGQVHEIVARYREQSEHIDPKAWRERSRWTQALDATAGLMAPVL